jgi:hypothetical protein
MIQTVPKPNIIFLLFIKVFHVDYHLVQNILLYVHNNYDKLDIASTDKI